MLRSLACLAEAREKGKETEIFRVCLSSSFASPGTKERYHHHPRGLATVFDFGSWLLSSFSVILRQLQWLNEKRRGRARLSEARKRKKTERRGRRDIALLYRSGVVLLPSSFLCWRLSLITLSSGSLSFHVSLPFMPSSLYCLRRRSLVSQARLWWRKVLPFSPVICLQTRTTTTTLLTTSLHFIDFFRLLSFLLSRFRVCARVPLLSS